MNTKQTSKPPAAKPLVTDTLNGQCENRRTVDGVAGRRCPRQGSLREISGHMLSAKTMLCDFCVVVYQKAGYHLRTITTIEGAALKGEQR